MTVTDFIQGLFQAQDRVLMAPGVAANRDAVSTYYAATPTGAAQASYEIAKAQAFQAWAASYGDVYSSISTAPSITSTTASQTATVVDLTATTTLLWKPGVQSGVTFSPDKAADMHSGKVPVFGPTDTVTTMVQADHEITIQNVGGVFQVLSDEYVDPFNESLAKDHTTPATEPASSSVADGGTTAEGALPLDKVSFYTCCYGYNRAGAIYYADKYWSSYNSRYLNYNPYGGDCANFVSQSMWDSQGGTLPSQSSYWTYHFGQTNPDSASPIAWRYTPSQHSFFFNNPRGSAYNMGAAKTSGKDAAVLSWDRTNMRYGDVHFYDWTSDGTIDHTAIVAAYLSDGTTLVDAHNTNYYHKRFDFGGSGATYYLDTIKDSITA